MKRSLFIFVLLLVASIGLSACGGNAAANSLKVDMTEFAFTPSEFTVPAGEEITLTVVNDGAVEHEFVIMKFGTEVGEDFGDEDEANVYWEVEADAGESKTEIFTAPSEPGEYQVVCGTEGHYVAGMIGKLTVVAP
jgi:uncharacterized cupredoxin-like copper-binding protein